MSSRRKRTKRTRRGPSTYALTLSSRLTHVLALCAALLLACHLGLYLYHYSAEAVHPLWLQLFDLDQENNFPTWYSGFLLLVAALLLWVCAHGSTLSRGFYVLSAGFLLLSVDEIAGVHESINSVIKITWAIPGGLIAVVIGLAFVPFLNRLPRNTAILFAVSGAIYIAGAAGLEIYGNDMVSNRLRDTLGYKLQNLVEEGFEMVGVLLFIHALVRYMGEASSGAASIKVEVG